MQRLAHARRCFFSRKAVLHQKDFPVSSPWFICCHSYCWEENNFERQHFSFTLMGRMQEHAVFNRKDENPCLTSF